MIMVRGVSWGMGFPYEIDILAVSRAGLGHEIEIKTTRQDLLRDRKKSHNHDSKRITFLWFAGPMDMREDFTEILDSAAGIILINPDATNTRGNLVIARNAKRRSAARAFTLSEISKLARLGTMRYWSREK